MCNDGQRPSKNSLDQAIGKALRVEIDQERLVRLEHYWIIQSQRQRQRRLAFRIIPMAAAVLAMVTVFSLMWYQAEDSQLAEKRRDTTHIGESPGPTESLPSEEVQPRGNSFSAGRPSSVYERLMFSARTNAQLLTLTKTTRIDRAINQLSLDPSLDVRQTLETSGIEPAVAETMLLRRLPRATSPQQAVILRLLGVCGTERSVPVLLRFGKQDMLRDIALTTIEKIVGIDNLAEVVGFTNDLRLRAGLMHRLLSTDSDAGMRGYLSLVRTEAVRLEALAVAKHAPQLPVIALLTLLDDEDRQVRLPAALVLGHVNGPEVSKLLIARVTTKPSDSKEAWLALLACRGDLAEEFLSYATQQPKLLGHCNYARIQWAQMTP